MRLTRIALTMLLAAGCASQGATGVEDAENASFGGKADGFGLEDGTETALAVLDVANELGVDALRDDVGLADRPAEAIIAFRAGQDGELDTLDDMAFPDLATLDAVSYVGPTVARRLVEYAEANGYIRETYVMVSYRYGTTSTRSTLVVYSDGTIEHKERTSAGTVTIEHDALTGHDIDQLRSWVLHSVDGGESTYGITETAAAHRTGELVGETRDGAPVVFDKIERGSDGYYGVTHNEATLAQQLRDWVHEIVDVDIPRDFEE